MKKGGNIDRSFLFATITLVVLGFFIFSSASLGLLARDGAQYSSVATGQIIGIVLGGILLFILSKIPYTTWRPFAPFIFAFSIVMTLLVFIPGLGLEINGAKRWINLGGFTVQPAEFLKIGAVIFFAYWLTLKKNELDTYKGGLLPLLAILAGIGAILLMQPDTGTFLVIAMALGAMYLAAGAKFRDFAILFGAGVVGVLALVATRPYVMSRFTSFLNPESDPLGAGYQIQQSLIAVGSGEWIGRGYGQSIQKFNFLPEPISDSIFSVAAEEFGLLGGVLLIGLFLFFAIRGLRIAERSSDFFGGLLALGVVILITAQSFVNIASMIGVMPLTGLPLLFVSHGGTALMFALAEVGLVLNISKFQKTKRIS